MLSDSVRNLGVIIDDRMSFDKHVSSVCQSCNYHMKALRRQNFNTVDKHDENEVDY